MHAAYTRVPMTAHNKLTADGVTVQRSTITDVVITANMKAGHKLYLKVGDGIEWTDSLEEAKLFNLVEARAFLIENDDLATIMVSYVGLSVVRQDLGGRYVV